MHGIELVAGWRRVVLSAGKAKAGHNGFLSPFGKHRRISFVEARRLFYGKGGDKASKICEKLG